MRTFLLAASAIPTLLAGLPAQAADMPVKNPMYKPPVAYSWTGAYFGGHLGAGWNTGEWRLPGEAVGSIGSGTAPGFLGGAQIGINYQIDAVVLGLEADASWANLSGETFNAVQALHGTSKTDLFTTIAGRFGVVADRALVYFKGGAAWAHQSHVLGLIGAPIPEVPVHNSKWGWMAGAGIEYALTRNWSAKVEYDFIDFGTHRFDITFGFAPGSVDTKQRIQTVKFGLNYKFDWAGVAAASY
jgi:outer membrane immunogenic protein